jgi:hypothetical protein
MHPLRDLRETSCSPIQPLSKAVFTGTYLERVPIGDRDLGEGLGNH